MTTSSAIRAESVYLHSKEKIAILNDLNLTVPVASVYALIGPSGCGKTSFLRCVIGYHTPTQGSVKVFGKFPGENGLDIPGKNIGYMPQDIALNCDLSILEMLVYFGHIYGIKDRDLFAKIRELMFLLDLPSENRLIGSLSGGQQRRISFAAAVLHHPKLLILDEPTVGCDPLVREKMWDFIFFLCNNCSSTIVITTHYIEEARRANWVGFMRKGKILDEDEPSSIIARFGVKNLEQTFEHLCRQDKHRDKLSLNCHTTQVPSILDGEEKAKKKRCKIETMEKCKNFLAKQFQEGEYWRIQSAVMNRIFLRFYKMKAAFYGSGIILFFIITIYGFFYGQTPNNLKVGILTTDASPANFSALFLDTIDLQKLRPIIYTNYDEALKDTKKGLINGFIKIGQNFTSQIRSKILPLDTDTKIPLNTDLTSGNIIYRADSSNIILLMTVLRSLLESYRNFTTIAADELDLNPQLTSLPITLGEPVYGQLSSDDYFGVNNFILPVFTVYLSFVHTVNFSLFSLMREKIDLMFERNYAAGVTTSQLLIGHFLVYLMITGVHVFILLLFVLYALQVPCHGSVFLAYCILLLQVATGIATTFVLALFSSGIGMMFVFTTGYNLACMFVGGVLWPIEALPYFMRFFMYLTPFSTSPSAMIAIMVKGLSLTHPLVYTNLVTPILYLITTSVISFICFTY